MIETLIALLIVNAIALCVIVYFVWLSKRGVSALLYPSVIETMRKHGVSKGEMVVELTIATLFFLPALLVWYVVILAPAVVLVWIFLPFLVRGKIKFDFFQKIIYNIYTEMRKKSFYLPEWWNR